MTPAHSRNARCCIFEDMTLDEQERVLALFEHERYPAGETILREGKSIQILWIIVSGTCEVVKTRDDHERVLATLEPGALFGEMSFFHPAPHSASVRAVTEVEVLRLSRERYNELLTDAPLAAYKIVSNTAAVLAERLRKMDDWVYRLVDGSDSNGVHKEEWHEFRAKLYSEWDF